MYGTTPQQAGCTVPCHENMLILVAQSKQSIILLNMVPGVERVGAEDSQEDQVGVVVELVDLLQDAVATVLVGEVDADKEDGGW